MLASWHFAAWTMALECSRGGPRFCNSQLWCDSWRHLPPEPEPMRFAACWNDQVFNERGERKWVEDILHRFWYISCCKWRQVVLRRSDIFAFGSFLLEVLSRKIPFSDMEEILWWNGERARGCPASALDVCQPRKPYFAHFWTSAHKEWGPTVHLDCSWRKGSLFGI